MQARRKIKKKRAVKEQLKAKVMGLLRHNLGRGEKRVLFC
jgi:hypothetical protein